MRTPVSSGINQSEFSDHGFDEIWSSALSAEIDPSDERDTIPIIEEQPSIPITKRHANLLIIELDNFFSPIPTITRTDEVYEGI